MNEFNSELSNVVCDLRSQLHSQQVILNCTLQMLSILNSTSNIAQYPISAPVWTQYAHPHLFPQVPEVCYESSNHSQSRKTSCKNCGAPVNKNGFCEYCATYN